MRHKAFVVKDVVHANLDPSKSMVSICASNTGDTLVLLDDANEIFVLDVANLSNDEDLDHIIGPINPEEEVRLQTNKNQYMPFITCCCILRIATL